MVFLFGRDFLSAGPHSVPYDAPPESEHGSRFSLRNLSAKVRDRLCCILRSNQEIHQRRRGHLCPAARNPGALRGPRLRSTVVFFFFFAALFFGNLYSNSAIRTFRPLNFTPSISRRKRWSRACSPGVAILPPDATIRCQGSPCESRSTRTTSRAPRGRPAASPIAP